ncbi:ParA family protein [Leptolyngbya sp. AN03gr2]|uniref:ParA family protein n=1 Tax=unclassified Leptolyngbya TaxID=2650499 RepID=UPI003D314742
MQIKLTVESNAGGSGKTTLTVHLAYLLGARGFRVVVIELDPNGSIALFTGLPRLKSNQSETSIACIFEKTFDGSYPLTPVWTSSLKDRVQIIRGGAPLHNTVRLLHQHDRPYEVLKHRLEDFPIEADVILIDTPASIEPMGLVGLAASTHLLVAVKAESKDSWSSSDLLSWYYDKIESLRLKPKPEILGFVPSRVNLQKFAEHRRTLGLTEDGQPNPKINLKETLPFQLERMGITCFPFIRESGYFLSACSAGVPVQIYRPGDEVARSFDPIADKIIKILKNRK